MSDKHTLEQIALAVAALEAGVGVSPNHHKQWDIADYALPKDWQEAMVNAMRDGAYVRTTPQTPVTVLADAARVLNLSPSSTITRLQDEVNDLTNENKYVRDLARLAGVQSITYHNLQEAIEGFRHPVSLAKPAPLAERAAAMEAEITTLLDLLTKCREILGRLEGEHTVRLVPPHVRIDNADLLAEIDAVLPKGVTP